jgi:hypothetical protein
MKTFNEKAERQRYRYIIQDSEAGNMIEGFNTLIEVKNALLKYKEEDDQLNGGFDPDFYEVWDQLQGEKVVLD